MDCARGARAFLNVAWAPLALSYALGSVACERPGLSGAKAGELDVKSPSGPRPYELGSDLHESAEPEQPKLSDEDVERIAVKMPHQKVPATSPQNPTQGPADAKVVLQIFSDFECPFCVRAAPTLADVQERYRGRIRVVFRNYPLPMHVRARPAARAALAAFAQKGNDGFWAFHDWLYSPQADLSEAGLARAAHRLALDEARFAAALRSPELDARVQADVAAGDAAGIEGTPAVFINDYYMMGARTLAEYELVIERALRESAAVR